MGFVSSDGLCGVWWSDVAKVYFTDTDGRYPIYLNTSFITYSNYIENSNDPETYCLSYGGER